MAFTNLWSTHSSKSIINTLNNTGPQMDPKCTMLLTSLHSWRPTDTVSCCLAGCIKIPRLPRLLHGLKKSWTPLLLSWLMLHDHQDGSWTPGCRELGVTPIHLTEGPRLNKKGKEGRKKFIVLAENSTALPFFSSIEKCQCSFPPSGGGRFDQVSPHRVGSRSWVACVS